MNVFLPPRKICTTKHSGRLTCLWITEAMIILAKESCLCNVKCPGLQERTRTFALVCCPQASDMLRAALLCAVLALPGAQPVSFPCPRACSCFVRDAAQCSGVDVERIGALGLPTNLTVIMLYRMDRGTLRSDSFRGMTVLQRLLLADSHISAVAPGAFNDLINLKTLRLSRNQIPALPGSLFDQLVLLEQLFLSHNKLTRIDQNLFRNLVNLQHLLLNNNQLVSLPADLFAHLGNLRVLDVSGNNLTHLPQGLLRAQAKLERLVLHSNQLVSLDAGLLRSLRALAELRLDRNRLHSLAPGAFDQLRDLSILTLSRNQLRSLPSALFLHLHNLTSLALDENPLEELPGVLFGEMAGLRGLWLNRTQLRTLPDAAFRNLSGLRALELTLNPRLGALPEGAFRGLGQLRQLSLSHNALRALPRGLFRDLRSLEQVRLEHNLLQTLPGDVFEDLPMLAEVLLGHNPWRCDCDLRPFLAWLRRHPGLVGHAEEPPRCQGQRPGLLLQALSDGDLGCPSTGGPPPHSLVPTWPALPVARGRPAWVPTSAEPWARAQPVAEGQGQEHNLFWSFYILLLATQAVITGVIVFAMIKLCRLFRKLIRERALV